MNYKNSYQRKQAIWREKWLRKVEKSQRQKDFERLKSDVANFATTVGEAITVVTEAFGSLYNDLFDIIDKG